MAVGAVARRGAAISPRTGPVRDGANAGPPPIPPDPDGIVRSPAAKAAYKAYMKGQLKKFFEDIIATATKKHH